MDDATLDIYFGDNLEVLPALEDGAFDLIYVDPPFNTGKKQSRSRTRSVQDAEGAHVGFGGRRYATEVLATRSFADDFGDEFLAFLEPRLIEARRLLAADGSFFLHLDYRESHYAKVLCDTVFGREAFVNEIVWAYDYGGRPKSRWPAKHDTILWYVANPEDYCFRYDDIDRIPYMAPGLVTPEKAARGKTPTDVWWHTIVPTNSRERTGYPTQKPLGIMNRIVSVHSDPGDRVLDFFAGSGTTGAAALGNGRSAVLVDANAEAMQVMSERFADAEVRWHGWEPSAR